MEWSLAALADLAVVVSGFGTIILVAILSRQLSIMKNESESRLHPWIVPVDLVPEHVTLKDGSILGYDEAITKMLKDNTIHLDTIHYKIVVTNSGTIPVKFSYTLIDQKEEFSKDAFKNEPMTDSIIIVPNHDFSHEVDVPFKELLNKGKYYTGIAIKYTVDKKKFQSGAIYKITSNYKDLLKVWHEKV